MPVRWASREAAVALGGATAMSAPKDRESIRVYLDLLDLEPSRRRLELYRRCAGQPELIAAVESLLDRETVAGAGGSPRILPPTDPGPDAVEQPGLVETIPDAPGPVDSYPPGTPIGPYRIERVIAPGGMGVVYLAREEGIRRPVALKVIRGPVSERARRRFLVERQALADLVHPNIVTLYTAGTTERGEPYFAMQYVDGSTLNDRPREPLATPRECARILLPVVDAVAYAHDQGVIHRDLKPANILVDGAGRPMVADFGLAHSVRDPRPATQTQVGRLSGTPGYMAPEQIAGGPGCKSEPVDVYALGGLLYFLLTGHDPHEGGSALEICTRALRQPPTPIRHFRRDVPRDLITLVEKAMEPAPERRLSSARVLADDLRLFLEGKPITTRRTSPAERAARWGWQHRVGVAAVVIPVLAVLVGSLVVLTGMNRRLSDYARQVDRKNDELVQLTRDYAVAAEQEGRNGGIITPKFRELSSRFAEGIDRIVRDWGRTAAPTDLLYGQALAHFQVARANQSQGRREAAFDEYRRSIARLRTEAEAHPDRPDIRYDLFRALATYGRAVAPRDRALAIALHREACEVVNKLAGDYPGEPDYRDAMIAQMINLGRTLAESKYFESMAHLQEAAHLADQLVASSDSKPMYRRNLALAHGCLATSLHANGRLDEADSEAMRGVDEGARLIRDLPDDLVFWDEQAARLTGLATIRADLGDLPGAELWAEQAVDFAERIAAANPALYAHAERRFVPWRLRAEIRLAQGKKAEALEDFRVLDERLDALHDSGGDRENAFLRHGARTFRLDRRRAERIVAAAAPILAASPTDEVARIALTRADIALGKDEDALRLVTTDLPIEVARQSPHLCLAVIAQARLGLRSDAQESIERLSRAVPAHHSECLFLARLRREAEELARSPGE
ncbi:serine/threonine-protein kinase [Aquisphaera insulae]|uniref:serine/threonine-protein kinase n=1 Tax=Aquisphaera insulae TaxID=2712864 RepID=UPI00202E815F|nr:serine/threonine-protein kinase [Aquisphaera insulae]